MSGDQDRAGQGPQISAIEALHAVAGQLVYTHDHRPEGFPQAGREGDTDRVVLRWKGGMYIGWGHTPAQAFHRAWADLMNVWQEDDSSTETSV